MRGLGVGVSKALGAGEVTWGRRTDRQPLGPAPHPRPGETWERAVGRHFQEEPDWGGGWGGRSLAGTERRITAGRGGAVKEGIRR